MSERYDDPVDEHTLLPREGEPSKGTSRSTVSGIYRIRNVRTGRVYIGRSRDIRTRWFSHKDALNRGSHVNENLQSDWVAYGDRAFEFTVLQEVSGLSALIEAEGRHLAAVTNPYNTQPVHAKLAAIIADNEDNDVHLQLRPCLFARFIEHLRIVRIVRAYREMGYSDEWIGLHLLEIWTQYELTQEWRERGAHEGREFAALTGTIHNGTFDLSTTEHREVKRIGARANLRDSMTNMELILTALGEETAKELHQTHDSEGFNELHADVHEAGKLAGATREQIESLTGRPVVSAENYKTLRQGRQRELQAPLFADTEPEE